MSTINGTPADDTFTGTADNDTFNGFAGIDTAQIASAGISSIFSLDSGGRWVGATPQGTDTLDSIEAVQFTDANVTLQSGSGEFRVNTTTDGDQFHPAMTALSDGGILVAWATTQEIFIQRFDSAGVPTGSEVKPTIDPISPPRNDRAQSRRPGRRGTGRRKGDADLFVYTSIDDSGPAPGAWDILLDFSSAERDQIDLTMLTSTPNW